LTGQHVLFSLIFQGEEQVTAEFLAGKVPEIVYKKAIQSIPGAVTYTVLLYRHECFTGKYTTRRIHTKPHPGLEWHIFHILISKDINDFTDIKFVS